jgi:dihydroxy-acid dehydratase
MVTLRSNYEVGSTAWAVRRSQWRALGLSDEDMEKPKIAIVNSTSELSSCFSHLDDVAEQVKKGIREAGGLPFVIHTTAPSDFITNAGKAGRYLMPGRDLIPNDIEVAVEGALLDGMVCLSTCDKTTPGHLMAAARLNLPTVIVIGGYQAHGVLSGRPVDIEDVFESVGSVVEGHLTADRLKAMTENAICSPGVCAGMGTANSMHLCAEALGLTVPGSAPVAAASRAMAERAQEAGRLVVECIRTDRRPRDILTAGAFANARLPGSQRLDQHTAAHAGGRAGGRVLGRHLPPLRRVGSRHTATRRDPAQRPRPHE